jgi:type IV pilus assembly protein PilV
MIHGIIRSMVRPSRTRNGFTLVEVLVSLVLIAVGLIGMAALTATLAHANRGATNRTRADQLVHEKIEEFHSAHYDSVGTGSDTVVIEGVEFARTWTVTPETPVAGVKQVILTTSWNEAGEAMQMRGATLVGEY